MTARLRPLALAFCVAGGGAGSADGAPAEPPRFEACKARHGGGVNGVGPDGDGRTGLGAGGAQGVGCFPSVVGKGREGLVRRPETFDADPARSEARAPGADMVLRGMADRPAPVARIAEAEAAGPAGKTGAAEAPSPSVYGGALALAGDPAYGEYLASECVTCHQISGWADGIPSIIGWPREAFVRALFAYKTSMRSHEVMRMVTMSLGDEEIASLAAYFGGLTPE